MLSWKKTPNLLFWIFFYNVGETCDFTKYPLEPGQRFLLHWYCHKSLNKCFRNATACNAFIFGWLFLAKTQITFADNKIENFSFYDVIHVSTVNLIKIFAEFISHYSFNM